MTLKSIESFSASKISVCKLRRFKLLERYDVPHCRKRALTCHKFGKENLFISNGHGLRALNLPSLYDQRPHGYLIETFKMINQICEL